MSVSDHSSFFNDTATTEIYTLSLHDALPILLDIAAISHVVFAAAFALTFSADLARADEDRKSTRLNSSHSSISYAVFCLKKKTIHAGNESAFTLRRHSLFTPTCRAGEAAKSC